MQATHMEDRSMAKRNTKLEQISLRSHRVAVSLSLSHSVSLAVSVCPPVRQVVLSVSDRCVVQQDSTLDGSRVMALQSRSPPTSTGSTVAMELQLNMLQFGIENWHIWMVVYIFVYRNS